AANLGTDTFNYLVTDRYGLTGVARVRIGLVPPGVFPPSVALDDTVTAQPGADVTVQPLTNDLIAAGDDPQVIPLDAELPDGVHLSTDVFTAVAPDDGAPPVQFSYLLRGAGGDGPPAVVTVRSQTGFLNPPKLTDSVATIDGDTAGAAPLANAWDIDGPPSGIHLVSIAAGTPAADGTVSGIPLADHIQALPFIAADADGATSAAIVFVPAAGAGAPQVRTDVGTIEMSANSTLTVNLSDYVFSPSGRQVRITVADSLAAAPGSGLSVQAASPTAITLTSQNDYVGPAAIGVEVTDGVDATDPDARRAFLTIPVQIGPNTPVLRCPAGVQEVVQGGADKILDITALCHVWTSDTVTRDTLAYTADWASPLADVAAAGGRVVTLSAAGRAVAGAEAPLQVGIAGTEATPQTLTVRVVAAGRPRLSVPDLTDIQQGASVRQRIALSSPLRDAVPTVVSVTQTAGPPCQVTSVTGDHFTLTPGADVHGTMTFAVVASDLADPSRTERQVRGTFTMTVFGRPDPPTPPAPGSQLLTHAVALTWSPGPDNGAAIDEYQVQASDGRFTQSCGRATRCDVTGVPNGTPIAFQTRSHNLGGWSDWSAPGPSFTPNETPGVATAFTATDPQNQQLTLTWKPAPVDGSPVTVYHLTWTGGAVGSLDLPGDATSATVTGLINNAPYAFKLVAENAAGRSPLSATTNGQSSGAPLGLAPPTITPQDLGDTTQVTVTWVAADPNGPGPVTYQVTRTGGAVGTKTFAPTTSLTLGDSIAYDGQTYTYTVTAVNGTGGPAHTSAAQQASFVAIGAPANWAAGAVAVVPTGQNGQVDLTFTYPPSRGASSRVELAWGGAASGTRTVPNLSTSGGTSSFRLTGLPNGTNLDATFQVCNEHACNGNKASASGSAFGPLATPKLQTQARSTNGDAGVCAKASGDGNGRNATLRLTATGPGGLNATTDVGTGAAALASPDWWCVDAGAGNRTVTFGATLITATTNPARTNSASATAQQRSPNDPPAPWPAGAVTLTPTGNNGELLLSLNYPNSNGNQARIEVTWPGGSKTLTSINPSGGTTSLTITGLPNGVPASVTVLLCNEEVCSATPGQSPAAAPFGPLAPPTITAQAGRNGDHKLCATAIGDGNGAEARLTITASTGASSPVQTGAGGLTVTWCPDVGGPNKTVTFTATLTSSTTPPRANPTAPTATATTPLDPPDAWAANPITLTPTGNIGELGATVVYPACNGASCKVTITWSGAASGSFTIDPATTGGGRWAKTFTGLPSGTNLTMSATVCNEQVCGPVSPTATGAAFGPPAAWAAGAITLTPTGTNGELAAVVTYPACHGNGCTVTITWTGAASGSQTVSPAEAGGGTWRKTIAGLANGANLTISAQVCNDKLCGDTSPTATNSAFGPLAPPTLNVYAHG
ncbi:MAG: fibronectin type III domain-containing protein, partial [Actinomycetia bacterium]|nr:fibronectin type III domain-containing protein [Actinomycetes bacterium]